MRNKSKPIWHYMAVLLFFIVNASRIIYCAQKSLTPCREASKVAVTWARMRKTAKASDFYKKVILIPIHAHVTVTVNRYFESKFGPSFLWTYFILRQMLKKILTWEYGVAFSMVCSLNVEFEVLFWFWKLIETVI